MCGCMKSLFHFLFKKISPISYARWLGVSVGKNCRLIKADFSTEPYLITLGDHVSCTAVRFETHDGGVWVIRGECPELDIIKPIIVGNNVFIGYGSVIMPGVTIGNDVVVGAYSVVTKDIPCGCVAVGVPAKVIKNINDYKMKSIHVGDDTKMMSLDAKKDYYLNKYDSDCQP